MISREAGFIQSSVLSERLGSIDALRGFVMILMLVDHMRETFYLHAQVSDPVDVLTTSPELFYTRLTSAICAPVFIWLTGLSAWLYSQKHSKTETSKFLLKRGIFLVFLELTLIVFLWAGKYPPDMFFLQVIWCIGLCMILLAGLIFLPPPALVLLAVSFVAGHNLLSEFRVEEGESFYVLWAILYQREVLEVGSIVFRTSYPLLPWVGVITLGYTAGPWFSNGFSPVQRQRKLTTFGLMGLFLFFIVRYLNFYGDSPWFAGEEIATTLMSFLSLTKYPPSFLFNLSMISLGLLLLVLFEKFQDRKVSQVMANFGAAPMFFYAFHLAVLKIIYTIAYSVYGPSDGTYLSFPSVGYIWLASGVMIVVLYSPTRWFAEYKQANKHVEWLRYF